MFIALQCDICFLGVSLGQRCLKATTVGDERRLPGGGGICAGPWRVVDLPQRKKGILGIGQRVCPYWEEQQRAPGEAGGAN